MKTLLFPLAVLALLAAPAFAAPGPPETSKAQTASVLLSTVTIEAPAWARHPTPHRAPAAPHLRR